MQKATELWEVSIEWCVVYEQKLGRYQFNKVVFKSKIGGNTGWVEGGDLIRRLRGSLMANHF